MAAVDQDGQAHDARATESAQGVERGADGAAGVEHVVDQDDGLAVDATGRKRRGAGRPGGLPPEVVAVERHVDGADGNGFATDRLECATQTIGEMDAASGDAQDDEIVCPAIALEDLVGDACQSTRDVSLTQHFSGAQSDPLPRLSGRNLKDVGVERPPL
ncbi:hypothetical protein GCM10025867_29100 [Frondihabitans sucicola]|uniref:Uncharacterized protein n=1 Tax=Frondihabitans sucicola TaxID=1268041 RepID=A0ABN6Y011_9MICO|nr:hypothetical protein GCM10025867_29100 [Frondihabitans sucicola]